MKKRSLEIMHPWPLLQPARTRSRWMGALIDWTLLSLFAFASITVLFIGFAKLSDPAPMFLAVMDASRAVLSLLLLWIATISIGCWGYFFLMRSLCGSTLGESIWGIQLVRDDGRSAGPKAVFLRELAALLSLAVLGAGFWLRFFNSQGRSWHDRLSGTRAVQYWPPEVDPHLFRNG